MKSLYANLNFCVARDHMLKVIAEGAITKGSLFFVYKMHELQK